MTTTPGFLSAKVATTQNLYTITYPIIDTRAIAISNVSKGTSTVVTSQNSLPPNLVDGDIVLVTGVGGMTQLATAGIANTNQYYVNVLSANTFALCRLANLPNINSSTFSNAVANTGNTNMFKVPQYNSVTSPVTVTFDTNTSNAGTDISLVTTGTNAGRFTLATDKSYLLTAVVNTTRTVPQTSTAGYQWFNVTGNVAFGPFVKFGDTCTTTITTSASTVVVLKVYSDESTFQYPNQLSQASCTIEEIGGYTVA